DWDDRSDTDCVTIGNLSDQELRKVTRHLPPPVNIIHYDCARFSKHLTEGSLFLHHCFTEGMLLSGDQGRCEQYKSSFRVATCFETEIVKYYENSRLLRAPNIFGGL